MVTNFQCYTCLTTEQKAVSLQLTGCHARDNKKMKNMVVHCFLYSTYNDVTSWKERAVFFVSWFWFLICDQYYCLWISCLIGCQASTAPWLMMSFTLRSQKFRLPFPVVMMLSHLKGKGISVKAALYPSIFAVSPTINVAEDTWYLIYWNKRVISIV